MSDIRSAPMIDSEEFKKLLDPNLRNIAEFERLVKQLKPDEHGQARSIGAGRQLGTSGLGGGNDSVFIHRSVAQQWLDDGTLQLRMDRPGNADALMGLKPVDAELIRLGLTRPK